jgi:hypothetical protein
MDILEQLEQELGRPPSRQDVHKLLGTYHFDKQSNATDIEYFGRIEMPDQWWQDGITETKTLPLGQNVTSAEIIDYDSGRGDVSKTMWANELLSSTSVQTDTWWKQTHVHPSSHLRDAAAFFGVDGSIVMKMQVQSKFDFSHFHVDHGGNGEQKFNSADVIESFLGPQHSGYKKFLILMTDLPKGSCLNWGNDHGPTKQGDIFSWRYAVPHCTVNFDDADRYLLSVVGKVNYDFLLEKFNYDVKDRTSLPTPRFESV